MRQPQIQPGSPLTNWAALSDLIFLSFIFFFSTQQAIVTKPHAEKGQLGSSLAAGQKQPWPCSTDNRGSPELAACPSPTAWLDNTRQIRSKHFDPSPSKGPIKKGTTVVILSRGAINNLVIVSRMLLRHLKEVKWSGDVTPNICIAVWFNLALVHRLDSICRALQISRSFFLRECVLLFRAAELIVARVTICCTWSLQMYFSGHGCRPYYSH